MVWTFKDSWPPSAAFDGIAARDAPAARLPPGDLKPSKKKSTERIDGIVAAIMALGRLLLRPEERRLQITRGIIWI